MMSAVEGKSLPTIRLNTALPPVTAPLPAWPRSGHPSDRSRFSRPARRDRLQSIPQQPPPPQPRPPSSPKRRPDSVSQDLGNDKDINGVVDPLQRVFRLERNLRFLREQHHLVLSSLQAEVEELKVKNRDLQFQLVMGPDVAARVAPQGSRNDEKRRASTADNIQDTPPSSYNGSMVELPQTADKALRLETLHSENRDLRAALHDARNRNMYLTSLIEQMKRQVSAQQRRPKPSDCSVMMAAAGGPMVSVGDIPPAYFHKIEEYEDAIQMLQRENIDMQTELSRLKATLREILSSNKWTPEAYMIARAVLQEGGKGQEYHRLPRIPVRPHEQSRRSSLPAIAPRNYNPMQVVRGQPGLPTVPQSKPPRSNPSSSGRYDQRYKHSQPHKKQ